MEHQGVLHAGGSIPGQSEVQFRLELEVAEGGPPRVGAVVADRAMAEHDRVPALARKSLGDVSGRTRSLGDEEDGCGDSDEPDCADESDDNAPSGEARTWQASWPGCGDLRHERDESAHDGS